ncbi:MAG: mechanosensitive ion channel [Euryarchaeota archaeon]|nr:mechanosensitive ion channel [Euryarchaeota archaeon]MDE1835021.1 mechanosensitive ion channel [Euryarchaeota archaeon]MDE1881342.1 mechanosensitive ion channel [Euryarchaeota archaeon]MDE2044860.1 mechanosensitive ion channel [Thermoplasmata archaeon]
MLPYLDQLGPVEPVALAGIVLVVTWLVARGVGGILRAAMQESVPHVAATAVRLSSALIWVVGIVIAVQTLGVATDILLLVVAIAGVALVVAFRVPLENLGAKYFSDVYVPFKAGDTVQVGNHAGKVIEINPISTVLLSEDDHLVSVPNSTFVREVVLNLTPNAWREVVIPVTLDNNVDLPSFESEVRKSLSRLRPRLDPRFPPILTNRARTPGVAELSLVLFVRRPQDREPVATEANRRVSLVLEALRRPRRRWSIAS